MDFTDVPESSRRIAALFDRAAPTYEGVGVPWFQPIGDRLVAEVRPSPGEHVLDIGCGRGAATFPLAEAVGPSGHVTGIDLSPGMVDSARTDAEARGLINVDVAVMDASAPSFHGVTFDVVTASLVLFFLPDPPAALLRWVDLLRPGGRIGVTTFGDADPLWTAVDDLFRPYLPPQMLDARTSGKLGPFGSDEGVEGLLASAGFSSVRTVGFQLPVVFDKPEQWYDWSWSHGQRAMWEAAGEDHLDEVRDAAFAYLEGCRTTDGTIVLTQRVRVTLADRP